MIRKDEQGPSFNAHNRAPRQRADPRTEVLLSILAGLAIIGVIIVFSVRGWGIPAKGLGNTITPSVLETPTPTATFRYTPTSVSTDTATPTVTPTMTWTPSATPSPVASATPSPIATSTPAVADTATPSAALAQTPAIDVDSTSAPTVSATASPPTIAPTLLEPQAGMTYANPITFRWTGTLNEGEAFQLTVWHVQSSEQVQTSPMTELEWVHSLPKDLVGEWRWVVWVVKDGQVLATSEEWFFWLNPHQGPGPRERPTRYLPGDTPTPKLTPRP